MRTSLLFSLIASAVLAASCGTRAHVDNRAADAAAIANADQQWSEAASRRDVTGTVGFYGQDAVMLPPNANTIMGPDSIRQLWATMLGPSTISMSWKASKIEVAQSGELGYAYGTYQDSAKDPKGGPPVNDTGKFVEVWKKQADGSWKCVVDAFNSYLPPAPEAPK